MNQISPVDFFLNHSSNHLNPIKPYKTFFYHLVLVLEGSCTYIINGEPLVLKPNDALFVVPGTLRERLGSDSHLHIIIFNFTEPNEFIPSYGKYMKNAVTPTVRKLLNIYPYITYHTPHSPKHAIPENPKQAIVIQNLFECILLELFEASEYQTGNTHITNALNYINDNITRPITLNDVCKATHLSKEYTARLFKQETNMTVSEYINKQKLALAKNMLANNNVPLKSISSSLGYENYTYFTKLFKECYKTTPQKMRNAIKNINE